MDATELEEDVRGLYSPDVKAAYASFLRLKAESEGGNAVYRFWDDFAGMMDSENSYVRTRGLLLIAENARWDVDHKMDGVLPGIWSIFWMRSRSRQGSVFRR